MQTEPTQACLDLVTASLTSFTLPVLGFVAILVVAIALMAWPWIRHKRLDVYCVLTRSLHGELMDIEFLPRTEAVRMLNEEREGRAS